jgi:hypothetical protein
VSTNPEAPDARPSARPGGDAPLDLGHLPSARYHLDPSGGVGDGLLQEAACRAGFLRPAPLQPRLGLQQGGAYGKLKRRCHLRLSSSGLRLEAGRRCPLSPGPLRRLSGSGGLAVKGFSSVEWERHSALVEELRSLNRGYPQEKRSEGLAEGGVLWASGKRQIIEQVIAQLKHQFALEHQHAKILDGLLAHLAAKVAASARGQWLNVHLGRLLRHLMNSVLLD